MISALLRVYGLQTGIWIRARSRFLTDTVKAGRQPVVFCFVLSSLLMQKSCSFGWQFRGSVLLFVSGIWKMAILPGAYTLNMDLAPKEVYCYHHVSGALQGIQHCLGEPTVR